MKDIKKEIQYIVYTYFPLRQFKMEDLDKGTDQLLALFEKRDREIALQWQEAQFEIIKQYKKEREELVEKIEGNRRQEIDAVLTKGENKAFNTALNVVIELIKK